MTPSERVTSIKKVPMHVESLGSMYIIYPTSVMKLGNEGVDCCTAEIVMI